MKYAPGYQEMITLTDGREVLLRAIQANDKAALVKAFSRLSHESRRRRFFTSKKELTEQELKNLTECDGINHYAIVAGFQPKDEPIEGVGVARLVRDAKQSSIAEMAIVVVDQWQGYGIGTLLLKRIIEAAAERGIEHVRAIALPDNEQIQHLIAHFSDDVEIVHEKGMVQMTFPIKAADDESSLGALFSVLKLAALGTVLVPLWLGNKSLRHLLGLDKEQEPEVD